MLGAAAALGAGRAPRAVAADRSAAATGSDRVLVLITLAGGNDALNTVVPVGDSRYARLRGDLALPPAAVHDLGDGFALHPALARTKGLWDDGRLAVVHGVGFAGLDRSHFHCMDVWQAGSTDDANTGWIGRWLDLGDGDVLDAVTVGRMPPLLGRGAHRSAVSLPLGPFEPPGSSALHDLVAGLADDDGRSPLGALVAGSTAELFEVAERVGPLVGDLAEGEATAYEGLSAQLGTVAALIDAGLPTKVFAVELGGFDTHAAQAPVHEALLGQLDAALGEFCAHVADRPVTVAAYSEFGRRVAPNASAGTDHGSGGTVLLAGAVHPGHHGEPPDLGRLLDGDLAASVDFRSIYGGLLEDVLGVPAGDVLGSGAPPPLALVGRAGPLRSGARDLRPFPVGDPRGRRGACAAGTPTTASPSSSTSCSTAPATG